MQRNRYLFLAILFLFVAAINCSAKYDLYEIHPGGFHAQIVIVAEEDITDGWEVTMKFSDKVKLSVDEASITASTGETSFTIKNDNNRKSLKSGQTIQLKFNADFDNVAGSNLLSATFRGKAVDLGKYLPPSYPAQSVLSIGTKGNYDYSKVLHASLLFYEAQRTGKLPADKRIAWRGDSMLDDKGDGGEDLSGGYFDAGDHVKFGFPMAYSVTVMAWGVIDYESSFTKAGELDNAKKAIKWGTDYFIKAHTKDHEFYGQVGNGGSDHGYWGRPEEWPASNKRPAYKITDAKPGSDLAGETAAALAAASIVLKSDATYSATLLKHAKQLYTFANEKRGNYSDVISDAAQYYKSWSGFGDELGWAAAWLLRATNETTYKTDFDKHWAEFNLSARPEQFSWDDKRAGLQILMAKISGDEKYKTATQAYCDWLVGEAPKSPKGMVYLDQWGPLRHASNVAWICLQAAELGIKATAYRDFAKKQIGYALGDTGRSFVVGVGVNPPERPHHRAASCPIPPSGCNAYSMSFNGPNPMILTGALVGGPGKDDSYKDDRSDYVHNEVATDYNAGFQSAVAALAHLS